MKNLLIQTMRGIVCALAALCTTAPVTASESGCQAAHQLVERVTPEYAARVHFSCIEGQAAPAIEASGDGILITADSVRECVRAYGYYLRKIAHVHLSWNGDNTSAAQFVIPEQRIEVPPTLPCNFAFNYCTLSYSGAHWSKDKWMQEIDRLALNGFRYVLVTSGLEKVWQGFLRDMDYPEEKIASFIANPCYAAWWNMGNLQGEGGPVSQELIESEAQLGQAIVQRLAELGMEPVLQGYVGFVPSDYPHHREDILGQGHWVAGYVRPAILRPDRDIFAKAAQLWYKNLDAVYGYKAKAFGGDLFHEGGNTGNVDLGTAARTVQQQMQQYSPGSLWFLQAWAGNPKPALLAGTDVDLTVILQLQKNLVPNTKVRFNYGGRRYVWCELANFGGNHGLYGGFEALEKLDSAASDTSGFGLLSEGIETNPLYYALFFERLNNRDIIDRDSFLREYALARYGSQSPAIIEALKILADSVYKPTTLREGCAENIICARPRLNANKASTWSDPRVYYDPADVTKAGKLMLEAVAQNPELMQISPFRYDLADICRQALSEKARALLPHCKAAFDAQDMPEFEKLSAEFCALIEQTATVLATHEDFLLGAYLEGAAQRAPQNPAEMTRSLRTLLTTWTPRPGTALNDYAHRQLAELMHSYYLPRWQAFFRTLVTTGKEGEDRETVNTNNGERIVQKTQDNKQVDAIEAAFPTADIPLLTQPRGDLLRIAQDILGDQG